MRDNLASVGLFLTFADGGKELNLAADIPQLCIIRKPVQQFNDELFVDNGSNLTKVCLIANHNFKSSSVTAPSEALVTVWAYLASTPRG